MNYLDRLIIRHVVPRMMKLSPEGDRNQDPNRPVNLLLIFVQKNGDWHKVTAFDEFNIRCRRIQEDDSFSPDVQTIPTESTDLSQLEFRRHYNTTYILDVGLRSAANRYIFGNLWLKNKWQQVRVWRHQSRARRTKLEQGSRIEVLRLVASLGQNSNTGGVFAGSIGLHKYGDVYVHHKDRNEYRNLLSRQLDILVEGGELKKENYGYKITAAGLKAVEEWDDATTKADKANKIQVTMSLIAYGAFIAGVASAWGTMVQANALPSFLMPSKDAPPVQALICKSKGPASTPLELTCELKTEETPETK